MAAGFTHGSIEDQNAARPLHEAGISLRKMATALGWSYGRTYDAVRAIRGLPSDNETRKAKLAGANAEVSLEPSEAESTEECAQTTPFSRTETAETLEAKLAAYRARRNC